jgi:hypothetical protein
MRYGIATSGQPGHAFPMRLQLATGFSSLLVLFTGCMDCGQGSGGPDSGTQLRQDAGQTAAQDAGPALEDSGISDAGDAGHILSRGEIATALCQAMSRGYSNYSYAIITTLGRCSVDDLIPDSITDTTLLPDIGVECLPGKEGYERFYTALEDGRVAISYEHFEACMEKGRTVRATHSTYGNFRDREAALLDLQQNDTDCLAMIESLLSENETCMQAWDCPPGLYCQASPLDVLPLRCLPPAEVGEECAENSEPISIRRCADDAHCYNGLCVQRQIIEEECNDVELKCISSLVCGAQNTCVQPGELAETCEQSSHCMGDLECVNGICTAPVELGEGCRTGDICAQACAVCRPSMLPAVLSDGGSAQMMDGGEETVVTKCLDRGAQGDACTVKSHCRNGFYCSTDGMCQQDGVVDDACDAQRPCQEALTCSNGQCASPALLGDPCQEGANPCQDSTCVNGICVTGELGGECGVDANCLDDNFCVNEICVAPPREGAPCTVDGRCRDDLWCDQERCRLFPGGGDPCTPDDECAESATCTDGLCVDKAAPGQPCLQDSDCLSDACLLGGTCGVETPSCYTVDENFIGFILFAAMWPWAFRFRRREDKTQSDHS